MIKCLPEAAHASVLSWTFSYVSVDSVLKEESSRKFLNLQVSLKFCLRSTDGRRREQVLIQFKEKTNANPISQLVWGAVVMYGAVLHGK